MSLTTDAARAALRARQGAGARYDAPSAPAEDLLLARRGTANFARKLGELPDDCLADPSLQTGSSRAEVIATVGYHARALAEVLACLRNGTDHPSVLSVDVRRAEIALGATLPARALRSLVQHAAIHLDVEWRDLSDADWDMCVPLSGGATILARATPLLRARLVWQAALDLGNGGRLADVPAEIAPRLDASAHS
ncbi:maleylpyruvate isomerase N-terminal domain-containing protein [Antarctobacter heliothermus]|uniref:maleylpyruvate isomerase N-terminal domain-containing protein n=1 Tax=Antarctobacter heliothermus TaxID=74033 RepID=UPI001BAF0976|nr:maleylpyruvate isomerase N-terminal domain-containing protein [Antarctobacter heliothermus]